MQRATSQEGSASRCLACSAFIRCPGCVPPAYVDAPRASEPVACFPAFAAQPPTQRPRRRPHRDLGTSPLFETSRSRRRQPGLRIRGRTLVTMRVEMRSRGTSTGYRRMQQPSGVRSTHTRVRQSPDVDSIHDSVDHAHTRHHVAPINQLPCRCNLPAQQVLARLVDKHVMPTMRNNIPHLRPYKYIDQHKAANHNAIALLIIADTAHDVASLRSNRNPNPRMDQAVM